MPSFLGAPSLSPSDIRYAPGPVRGVLGTHAKFMAGQAKVRELARKSRLLKRKLEKLLRNLDKLSGSGIPRDVQQLVEDKINAEGWMEKIIEKRFKAEAEHGAGSRRWKQLRPSTVKRRGSAHPILFDSGEMFAGAVAAVADTFTFRGVRKWNVGDVGVDYAEYHQTGTDRMPARRFFDQPNTKEMQPIIKRAKDLVRAEIRKRLRAG